jgi:hypothetical protein
METCIECGGTFGCGGAEGKTSCWCAELPMVMPVGDAGCLCPECLKAEIARRVGDCFGCAHAKTLKSKGGGAIFLCGRAEKEAAYERYPALPRRDCSGRTA